MMNSLPWHFAPSESAWRRCARRLAASLLQRCSDLLARVAHRLASAEPEADAAPLQPMLEFHAEAGAPEGALYVDGRLVGHLLGVTRL
jgi:hypothetical protein